MARAFSRLFDLTPSLLALLAALLVSGVLLIVLQVNPIDAYTALAQGAFGNENATAETLVKAIPVLFVAIGICVAFRAGMTNIGGEGQMIMGAVAGTATTLALPEAPGLVVVTLSLLMGFIAGALYGGIAGVLKAYFNVNEILTTIMLNQVAVQLMNYLLNGPLLDPSEAGANHIPKTARIAEQAELGRLSFTLPDAVGTLFGDTDLFGKTRLHIGLLIAVVLAIVVYVLLWRTIIGYRIRAVGENERASRYAGIKVKRYMLLSMLLAGGMAGLGGVVQVLGLTYRLQTDGSASGFTANAGFNGIVAALFGGLNPIGAIPASVLFGGLLVGAQKMQREVGVSASLITALNGVIVIFVVSSQIFVQRRARARLDVPTAPAQTPTPVPNSHTRGETV